MGCLPDWVIENMRRHRIRHAALLLVEYTGRLFREGKAAISREVSDVLARLGSSAAMWQARLQKLIQGRRLGRFFTATRQRLRDIGQRRGLRRVPNLGGCPAS